MHFTAVWLIYGLFFAHFSAYYLLCIDIYNSYISVSYMLMRMCVV